MTRSKQKPDGPDDMEPLAQDPGGLTDAWAEHAVASSGALGGATITYQSEVVGFVVRFANGDLVPEAEDRLIRHAGRWGLVGVLPQTFPWKNEQDALQAAVDYIHEERQLAVEILDAAVAGTRALTKRLRDDPRTSTLKQISQTPTAWVDPWKKVLTWRIQGPGNATAWIMLAGMILATTAKGQQTDVGRCQLESCGRFFVIQRGKIGKPQLRYCGEKHRLEQHNLNSAERQRRARANRPKPRRTR